MPFISYVVQFDLTQSSVIVGQNWVNLTHKLGILGSKKWR